MSKRVGYGEKLPSGNIMHEVVAVFKQSADAEAFARLLQDKAFRAGFGIHWIYKDADVVIDDA